MPSMVIRDPADILRLVARLKKLKLPLTVSWVQGEDRTRAQNSLLHQWFGQVAAHYGDRTMTDVKGDCHVEYGLAIRLRDPVFAWVWARTGAHLTPEEQRRFFAKKGLPMSSVMKLPELNEYMTAMSKDYRAEGVYLTDPEARKYEQEPAQ